MKKFLSRLGYWIDCSVGYGGLIFSICIGLLVFSIGMILSESRAKGQAGITYFPVNILTADFPSGASSCSPGSINFSYASNAFQVCVPNVTAGTAANQLIYPQQATAFYQVPLQACGWVDTVALGSAPTGAPNPGIVNVATGQAVNQVIGSAAAGSYKLDCNITPPTTTTTSHGVTIKSVDLFYGIQTTALTSITTPTINSLTLPATGAAASGTVATNAGGTLTVLPASLQLTTTTSGQCFHENIALGTPVTVNTPTVIITMEQVFGQTAASAEQLQLCGISVNYTNVF